MKVLGEDHHASGNKSIQKKENIDPVAVVGLPEDAWRMRRRGRAAWGVMISDGKEPCD